MRVFHKKFFLTLLIILVLAYGLWQARDFLSGPRVYLESPAEGETLNKNPLVVKGRAFDVAKFTLNGRTIFTDEEGNFEEELLLALGVNIIEIQAEDRFGHKALIQRTLFLEIN